MTSTAVPRALTSRPLHTGWWLQAAAGPVPHPIGDAVVGATVPGCVHTDLLDAELIPDPFLDDNESLLAWIGLVDWTYRTSFAWTPDGADRVDLAFASRDTVAGNAGADTIIDSFGNDVIDESFVLMVPWLD